MTENLPQPVEPAKALVSKVEARKHTDRILGACSRLHLGIQEWQLLCKDAYERGVHLALGYQSWAAYAEAELGMSPAQAHRALARDRVIDALKEIGVARPNELVSGRQARALHGDPTAMPEIAAAIEAGQEPAKAISDATKARQRRRSAPVGPPRQPATSLPFVEAPTRDVVVPGDTLPREDQPAAPVESSTGSERRTSPSADGSTASRGTQRPAPPQQPHGWPVADLLAGLRAVSPDTIAGLATADEYREIMGWARDFQRVYQAAHPAPAKLSVVPAGRGDVAPRFKHPSKPGR